MSANSAIRTVPASTIGEIGAAVGFAASARARGDKRLSARPVATPGAGMSDITQLTSYKRADNAPSRDAPGTAESFT
jgi:hypothetical protein